MKKLFLTLLSIMMLFSVTQAVTLTIVQPQGTVTMTRPAGSEIKFKDLTDQIKWWKVIEGDVEVIDGGFTMPDEDVTVEAMYTGNIITVIQNPNGTITPGSVGVEQGGSRSFTITPYDGYKISSLLIDGVSQLGITESGMTYEFTNVISARTIEAIYSPITYTITATAGEGGTISPASVTVNQGGSATFTITPSTGYALLSVSVDGAAVERSTTCTVTNVIRDRTVTATFGLYGDVNGDGLINMSDSSSINRYIEGYDDGFGDRLLICGDVNVDGIIDTYDSDIIQLRIVGYTQVQTLPYTGKLVLFVPSLGGQSSPQFYETGETKPLSPYDESLFSNFIVGWTTTSGSTTVEYDLGQNYTANTNMTLYSVDDIANEPILGTGLTPVNWSGTTWVTTDQSNWDYNYTSVATATQNTVEGNGAGQWANAQTSDESQYVWIPRFTYKIVSGENNTGNSWNSLTASGSNRIRIKFSNGIVDDTTDGYIKHPAFTLGSDELTGFWVAKYEASRNDATADSTGSGTTPASKPGVKSWVNTNVSDMFDYAYNLKRNLDSHMMKNSEWGAVAYLTNAIGRIPYINNSSTMITGNAGGSQDASSASGVTNAWDSDNGVKASTTHNVYGIYDMSGGAYEYVAAYLNNGSSDLSTYASNLVSSYSNTGTKYVDVYPMGSTDTQANNYAAWSNIKGDAMYETSGSYSSSNSWDGDSSKVATERPIFRRGGRYDETTSAGIFNFYYNSGFAVENYGFRTVLAPKEAGSNSSPSVPTVSVSSKTTNSFTVSTVATDDDGDNLIYQLYIGETLKDTSASTASGVAVTLTASELSEYTNYDYEIKVTDEIVTTSTTSNVRTHCSGIGSTYCSPTWCDPTTYCSYCSNGSVVCAAESKDYAGSGRCTYGCWAANNGTAGSTLYNCGTCRKDYCEECFSSHTINCTKCNGLGSWCTHGYNGHYTCPHYIDCGTTHSIHTCCSHGYVTQHD